MSASEKIYSIALRRCQNIGDITFGKLIKAVGSAENVWSTPKKDLEKILGIGSITVKDIGNPSHLTFAEREYNFCQQNNITILLHHKDQYPNLLSDISDPPAILFCKGNLPKDKTCISLVGTRNCTNYGKNFVGQFIKNLPENVTTVSGLAYGIDAEVHLQSLENNIPTIAVLAHGLHLLYPSKHKVLAQKIVENQGALITEFNTSDNPDREHFIQRNRIIAGISKATIVVETAFGGGSISTATFANQYNRDVFALPGKIDDKYSQGCNHLIYQNKAAAISTINDLYQELALNQPLQQSQLFSTSEAIQLTDLQKLILKTINNPVSNLDEIAEMLDIPSYKILQEMLQLEILGLVKSTSGRQYIRL